PVATVVVGPVMCALPSRLEAGIMPEVRSRGGLCPASENAVRAPPPPDCLHAVLCSVRSLLLRRGGEPARPGGFDQRSRHDVVQATRSGSARQGPNPHPANGLQLPSDCARRSAITASAAT